MIFYSFTENKFHYDGYDTADSDGDVLIEEKSSLSPGRFVVNLPVTFFDYARNVSLLSKCKPFVIQVVDICKHQWYLKKQIRRLAENIVICKVAHSNTEKQRKEIVIDFDTDKQEFNMHTDALKPKITPVDITAYADSNKLIKRNTPSETNNRVKKIENNSYLPRPLGFKSVEYVDFKKNIGLVGLKISHTIDLNATVMNARPKYKKEEHATVAKYGCSAKFHPTFNSDKQKPYSKIERKTKDLLKINQDNIQLSSTFKDTSEFNVNVKEPAISLNNKINKEFNEQVETAFNLVTKSFLMNEYLSSNEEKHDDIEKAVQNPMQEKYLPTSTISLKSNSVMGQHVKFNPGISTTKPQLHKKTKLLFGSQKIIDKITECTDIKNSTKKIKSMTQTRHGMTKVRERKKDKEAKKEKKGKHLNASKPSSGMNVALNKDNVLKMVISKKPNTELKSLSFNDNSNFDPVQVVNKFTTRKQTPKTLETMHDVAFYGKQHNTYENVLTGKCLPNNGLHTNNNELDYNQFSSKKYPTKPNPSMGSQYCHHNCKIPTVGNKQLCSFYISKSGQTNNINALTTSRPESHVISGASQIFMSNNVRSAVLEQNIATKENSVKRTLLPAISARRYSLPEIVHKKACTQNTIENVPQNASNTSAAAKSTERNESRSIFPVTDGSINKQENSIELATRVYGMFDANGNVKSMNNTHRIYLRPAYPKSNTPGERSNINVHQARLIQQRRNTSECAVVNHQPDCSLTNPSDPREIIAMCKSGSTCCVNVEKSATLNNVNSKKHLIGPNGVPVIASLGVHLNGTRVPSQESHKFVANSNQNGTLSFAQENNNVLQRLPVTYTSNVENIVSNMNFNHIYTGGNVRLNVNHNNNAVPMYQPMFQQHSDDVYQWPPEQTFIGNRPTPLQNRPTYGQRSMMNMSVDQGLQYPNTMQNDVPMNNVHCAPIYNKIHHNPSIPVEGQYYNPNQSNGLWPYLYPPPPPPPPVQTTSTFFPPVTVNASLQSTVVPSSVTNSSSIIGQNNSGIIRKINIVAVPLTDKENPSIISSECTNSVGNFDDKPANSKLEMLEELTKVIMNIPPDSPLKEKKNPSYPPTKSNEAKEEFSNPPDQSLNLNNQIESITTTNKIKSEILSSTKARSTAPDQNVQTSTVSEHNIPTLTQAKPKIPSPRLNKRNSSITSPPKQTAASPQKNVRDGSSTETSTEICSKTLGSSCTPNMQNFKRPHPTMEATYPEVRKLLSNNPKIKPGPLSKKPKLHLFQKPSSPNRDRRVKLVVPATNIGYSPPILPILTYEKTLEYLAQAHSETRIEKDDFTPNGNKLPVSILRNSSSKNNWNQTILCEEYKQTTQDKSVKKISLDEYKKRVAINSEKDSNVNNIPIKLECKTEKLNGTKQGSDLDLGYDSDSTVIL